MARVRERSGGFNVTWRSGRGAPEQSTTWPTVELAGQAQRIAEAHRHRISADDVYAAILGEPDADDTPITPTLREWSETWLARHRTAVSADTLDDYRAILRIRILPKLGRVRLSDITTDLVCDWLAEQCLQVAPATVRKAHAILVACLGAAVPRHLAENPAVSKPTDGSRSTVRLPTVEREEMCCLEPHESRLVVASAVPSIRDLVEVTIATGIRLGEAIPMRVGDVTTKRRAGRARLALQVVRALKRNGRVGPPKSRAAVRSITVTDAAEDTVRRIITGRRPSALLFPAPRGGMWSRDNLRERYWKPTVAVAQRCAEHPPPAPERVHRTGPVAVDRRAVSTCECLGRLHKVPRFHDLRHTHASYLIAAGWDMLAIQKRMGHANIQITFEVYGHLLDYGQDARLDALDALMSA